MVYVLVFCMSKRSKWLSSRSPVLSTRVAATKPGHLRMTHVKGQGADLMRVPDAGMKGNSLYKALIGKIVLVPGSEFGVDVPELYYKGSAPLLCCMLGQRVLMY